MDVGQIVQAVLYVIPGFIATGIMFFRVPTKKRTDFERLIISIIFSLPIYGTAALLDRVSSIPLTSNLPLYFLYSVPVAILAGYLTSALITAEWFPDLVRKVLKVDFELDPGVWNLTFDVRRRVKVDGWEGWVRVYTTDGAIYIGHAQYYTIEPDAPHKELFISSAHRVRLGPDGKVVGENPIDHGVYLPIHSITRVEFLQGLDST